MKVNHFKMQSTIIFLLMGGLSIATASSVDEIEKDLRQFLKEKEGNSIDSEDHHLQILDERLGSSEHSLVWKARFDGQDVAVKIFTNQSDIDEETAAYQAANAMNDPNIERKGIPKIYYTGHFIRKHPIIVMTLFDETLYDRWTKQNRSFNAYSTLEVFLQLAKTLEYLQIRGVTHNDIKPSNIFLRGSEVFLGDFDIATLNGVQTEYGSPIFGSSAFWERGGPSVRHSVDDLESLVYTIWRIENIYYKIPSGLIINMNKDNKRFVLEQCKHFEKFPRTFVALKVICYDEMLPRKPYINYKSIVDHLTAAKAEVQQITGQTRFEWLGFGSGLKWIAFKISPSSFSFAYPGEDRPHGYRNPEWLNKKKESN